MDNPGLLCFFCENKRHAPLARESHVKEDDIRPERLRAAQQEFIDHDIAWLLARKGDWVAVDCPARAGTDRCHVIDTSGVWRPQAERERGARPAEAQRGAQGSGETGPACGVRP